MRSVQRGGGDGEGAMGGRDRDGETGGVDVLAGARSGEGEKGRVRQLGENREGEGGNGKGETRRGQQEGGDGKGGKGEGRRRDKRRGDFTDGYDEMPGWNMECLGGMRSQSFLTLFTHVTPGTPASYIHNFFYFLFFVFKIFYYGSQSHRQSTYIYTYSLSPEESRNINLIIAQFICNNVQKQLSSN